MVKTKEGVIFQEGFLPWKTLYEVRAMIGYLVTFLNLYDEIMRQDPAPIPPSSILPQSQRLARILLNINEDCGLDALRAFVAIEMLFRSKEDKHKTEAKECLESLRDRLHLREIFSKESTLPPFEKVFGLI